MVGFKFQKLHLNRVLLEQINDIEFFERNKFVEGYDVMLEGRVRAGLACNLCVLLKPIVGDVVFDMKFEAHKSVKGDYMSLHSDTHEPGDKQVLLWIVNGELKGREFIYGTLDKLNEIKVETGLCCVMDIKNPNYIHGFNMQESGEVITITGTLPDS